MTEILPTSPYKGTRDFYPYDHVKKEYIFSKWTETLQGMGFEQYETSVLENAHIYIAKSGEELGGSQLYNFYDKGDRFVALRPEQTPSLARMIAHKFEQMQFPLRWFSIPNCFRYERPQKGRLREHWQLNVDIIGVEPGGVELELLSTIGYLFKAFGADKKHFKVMYNHRKVLDSWLETYKITDKKIVYSVLDDWYKVEETIKIETLTSSLTTNQTSSIFSLVAKEGQEWDDYLSIAYTLPELTLLENLKNIHPSLEYEFNPTIIRGIAYYTGIVFEAFDKNPENPRSLFGGGRYDDLMLLFGKDAPAIGFGWGDVTMHEFLEGHKLWPESYTKHVSKVGIMPFSQDDLTEIFSELIPQLLLGGKTWDINYEYDRSENKRWQTLKKRGCDEIIKIGQ